MSQAGGPNSAGSVNIDFTGNVAPLEQAAKKAEAVVEQSAAKMKATVEATASPTAQAAATANAGGPAVSSGFGIFGGDRFGRVVERQNDSIYQSLRRKSQALGQVIGLWTRFVGVIGLVVGAGAGIVALLDRMGRKGYDTAAAIKETNKSIEGMFAQFQKGEGSTPEFLREQEYVDLEVAKQDALDKIADLRNQTRYDEAFHAEKKMNEQIASSRDAIEQRYRQRSSDAVAATNKKRLDDAAKVEYERGMLAAKSADEIAAVYYESEAESQRAQHELSGAANAELLDIRLQAIEIEKRARLQAITDLANKEIDEQKRAAARTREIWRQVREDQTTGTGVSGFAAGNLSQSLDLLSRQRSAVEGMSINYGGD